MKKYLSLLKISWQNGLAYPISVLFWRIRQFLLSLMSLTLWTVIFASSGQSQAFGYAQQDMITYIFLVGILQSVILATALGDLGDSIYSGRISNELVKPVNIFAYLAVEDLADKAKNIGFIIIESTILFLIFHPVVVVPKLAIFLLFLLSALLGAILLFLIMLLFGAMGFWTPDVWGPRFLFYMFIDFTAGKLYPLAILPKLFQQILFFTPFPYLSYVQTEIFLEKYSTIQTAQAFFGLTAWIIVAWLTFTYFWRKGLKEYGALGR